MRKSYHKGGYRENGENITNKKVDIFIVRVLIVIIELRLFIHINNMKYK
jgi:hypothetical protein